VKKSIFVVFLLQCIVISAVYYETAQSQWQSDVRLTYDTGICLVSLNNARGIAANENYVHAVWCDERNGNREIYYKRSTDYGTNWGPDVRFTYNSEVSYRPSVSLNGNFVHVVWCDNRDGNFEIYYKRSTDYGSTWSQDIRITNTPTNTSWAPSMAVNGSIMHVVWEEVIASNEEIYYKQSTDNGISWSNNVCLSNDETSSFYPSVAVSGTDVHAVWYGYNSGYRSVFYKHSLDGGINWSPNMILTNVSAQSYNPAVAAKNQIVHVVWHDTRYGNEEVFYMRSSNAGSNWGSEVRLTNNTGISYYPSICLSGTSVHLAWYDNSDGNFEIYYGLSTNEGLTWQPNIRLTYNQYDSYRPSIAAQDTMLHIIWNDNRDGDWEMYYKRNFTTNTIHIGNISSEIPSEVILRQNYPNPFNPETKISFAIPKEGYTTLRIFDVNGKEVKTLVNENKRAGNYSVDFNAGSLSSGVYFCSLKSGGVTITRKLILLK